MKMKTIHAAGVKEPAPRTWSNAKVCGNQFFVSGMTAHDGQGHVEGGSGMYDQAMQTFGKIKGMVEAAGGTMADVMKIMVYVTNIKNNVKVWAARREFFTGDFPASTLVEVSALAAPEILVEIEAIAHIGKGKR